MRVQFVADAALTREDVERMRKGDKDLKQYIISKLSVSFRCFTMRTLYEDVNQMYPTEPNSYGLMAGTRRRMAIGLRPRNSDTIAIDLLAAAPQTIRVQIRSIAQ